jgi:hypothetical protein
VGQVIPEANTRDVETDVAITVMFNRPVVPLVSTGQQADLLQPLEFEPAVSGQGEWVSTSIYRFTPEDSFAGATRYQAIVPAGLEDITGGTLAQDFTWNFTTESPSVVGTVPENGSTGINPSEAMTVTFNMPMDKGSAEAAFVLQPTASVEFIWSENDSILTAVPAPILELETPYELSLTTSARAANGQAGLERETTIFFDTVPYPTVLETIPANGEIADRHQRGVTIVFASPMDLETIKDGIIIKPAPDDPTYYFNEYNNSLYITFDLERNREYSVTVPGSAADPYGNTLGEAYSWSFTTPGYDPLVSLNLPQPISQLSTSQPTAVDIIHRNVSRIDATLFNADLPIGALVESRIYDYLPTSEALRTWSIPVEKSQDLAEIMNLNLADGDTLPPGVFFFVV